MQEISIVGCEQVAGGKISTIVQRLDSCFEGGKVGWALSSPGNEACAAAIGCVAAVAAAEAGATRRAQEASAAMAALASNGAYSKSQSGQSSNPFDCMSSQANESGEFDNGRQGWAGGGC